MDYFLAAFYFHVHSDFDFAAEIVRVDLAMGVHHGYNHCKVD